MSDADYEELQMNWEPDNGYVPTPGGRCRNNIVSAVTWIWAIFAVVVGA